MILFLDKQGSAVSTGDQDFLLILYMSRVFFFIILFFKKINQNYNDNFFL